MFISYNWLRELTGTKLLPEEIRERLTNVGLAIDVVEPRGNDFVLDVEVPSNRGDCLSHVGIARELAVIEKSKVQTPESKVQNASGRTAELTTVEIQDADLCPRYAARIVRGVKIAPSPEWLMEKVRAKRTAPSRNWASRFTLSTWQSFGRIESWSGALLQVRRLRPSMASNEDSTAKC